MLNKKALVFSRNLAYNLGGAERSLLNELSTYEYVKSFELMYALQDAHEGNKLCVPKKLNIKSSPCKLFKLQSRFFYYEYIINKKNIFNAINDSEFNLLITQNRWAPAAILAATKKGVDSIYYLRDETSIGIINNYYSGYKKLLKDAYKYMELPGLFIYNRDNFLALKSATKVISNSNYLASELWERYKVDSQVIYPKIDEEALRYSYNKLNNSVNSLKKGIVIIGDTRIKGITLFLQLAEQFSNEIFYIFGKNTQFRTKLKNVKHMGWAKDAALPYTFAKVVLVPSLWNEAFGRVAIEANTLDLAVIVSEKGGLPEAVNYDKNKIAHNFNDFSIKLKNIL